MDDGGGSAWEWFGEIFAAGWATFLAVAIWSAVVAAALEVVDYW